MAKIEKMVKKGAVAEVLPPLDRFRADEILEPNQPIWGLGQIAARLGFSVDTVRDLAGRDDTPIYRPSGKYFAWSGELDAWLRSK